MILGYINRFDAHIKILKPRPDAPDEVVTVSAGAGEITITMAGDNVHVEIGTAKNSKALLIHDDGMIT